MAKLTLDDLASLENQTGAIQTINANNDRIETALENTLSRDGTSPNQMGASLDMNGQRIYNLPAPQSGSDAARLSDIQGVLTVEGAVIPAPQAGYFLSNDGTYLVWTSVTIGSLQSNNNLSDVVSTTAARTNLGLGTAATKNIGTFAAGVPLLENDNTWNGDQTFSEPVILDDTVTVTNGPFILSYNPSSLNNLEVGFRGAPQKTSDSNYTFVLNDSGYSVVHTSGSAHAWTIPPNSSVAYPVGTVVLLRNSGAGVVTLTRGAGVTLRKAGSGTSADVAMAQWGFATLYKEATDTWVVSGTGLT